MQSFGVCTSLFMTTTGIVAGCGPGQDLKRIGRLVCWQSRLLILDVLGTARFLHRMLHFLVSVFASLIFHMKSLNGLGILRKLGDTKLNLPLPLERLLFHMMTSLKV